MFNCRKYLIYILQSGGIPVFERVRIPDSLIIG